MAGEIFFQGITKKKKRKKENYGIISFVVFQNVFLSFISVHKMFFSLIFISLYHISYDEDIFPSIRKKVGES